MNVTILELRKIIESSSDMAEIVERSGMTRQGVHWHLNQHGLEIKKKLRVVKKLKAKK